MMILLKEVNTNINALCASSTLKSESSASRAISAVAELPVVSDAKRVSADSSAGDNDEDAAANISGCSVIRYRTVTAAADTEAVQVDDQTVI